MVPELSSSIWKEFESLCVMVDFEFAIESPDFVMVDFEFAIESPDLVGRKVSLIPRPKKRSFLNWVFYKFLRGA